MTLTSFQQKIYDWVQIKGFQITTMPENPNGLILKLDKPQLHPVALVFPNNEPDLVVIESSVLIDGAHKQVMDSMTDPVQIQDLMQQLQYEAMSSLEVGATPIGGANGKIQGVSFTKDVYEDGINKNLFFNSMTQVRSAKIKFINFVNKIL